MAYNRFTSSELLNSQWLAEAEERSRRIQLRAEREERLRRLRAELEERVRQLREEEEGRSRRMQQQTAILRERLMQLQRRNRVAAQRNFRGGARPPNDNHEGAAYEVAEEETSSCITEL
ncbi:hypothetical protein HS088_TW22G00575 [Tripterygium wilfordii]|uniref:Uncharacterized protein n=1 Tax=Tripterygium wilfordii TaxID=458696 RepID=A0A7J7BYB2_TRIWF|nr:trichohyalin-like isoform X1 [Tripterygium wilfordii]KAF5726890.1 hypothetical protein HS088_TW22G00575 [Tripterygium wilfordii]